MKCNKLCDIPFDEISNSVNAKLYKALWKNSNVDIMVENTPNKETGSKN